MRGMSERASLYRSKCIESALAIVNFTIALDSNHRQDFWLPCNTCSVVHDIAC
jgi:hypothetical protein